MRLIVSIENELKDLRLIMNLLKHQLVISKHLKTTLQKEIRLLKKAMKIYQQKDTSDKIKKIQKKTSSLQEKRNQLSHQLEQMNRRIKKEAEEKLGASFLFYF